MYSYKIATNENSIIKSDIVICINNQNNKDAKKIKEKKWKNDEYMV